MTSNFRGDVTTRTLSTGGVSKWRLKSNNVVWSPTTTYFPVNIYICNYIIWWYVYIYIYMYMIIYKWLYTYIYIYESWICMYIYNHIWLYAHDYVYIYIHYYYIWLKIWLHMIINSYIWLYIYMFVCVKPSCIFLSKTNTLVLGGGSFGWCGSSHLVVAPPPKKKGL